MIIKKKHPDKYSQIRKLSARNKIYRPQAQKID